MLMNVMNFAEFHDSLVIRKNTDHGEGRNMAQRFQKNIVSDACRTSHFIPQCLRYTFR